MTWRRTSTIGDPPHDAVGDAVAEALDDLVAGASVELRYFPDDAPPPDVDTDHATATATGRGPDGWGVTVVVRLSAHLAALVDERPTLVEMLETLPAAGLRVAEAYRQPRSAAGVDRPLPAPLRRALRDTLAAVVLGRYLAARSKGVDAQTLIDETIGFLVELSSTRVESHDLTHGVIVADVFDDEPRLEFAYPDDVRAAKRAPLLFDGQHALLVVDTTGRARTEIQRHRLDRVASKVDAGTPSVIADDALDSGSLVAEVTRLVGGVGFFLRTDRSIWTFVDGEPLLVRRGEHWTAFPLELGASVTRMIGGGAIGETVVHAAFIISAQPRGAILAIVADADRLDGIVPAKDRYDRRNNVDPTAMRPETRLHHLIDADDIDEQTLVRLASLDGATILDRDGNLLAYGAIVATADSEYEGARTAAARTLSEHAEVVLKVSVDGDITIFRDGRAITTLLGRTLG